MADRAVRAEGAPRARQGSQEIRGAARRCPTCGARYPVDFLVCPKDATSLTLAGEDEPPSRGCTPPTPAH